MQSVDQAGFLTNAWNEFVSVEGVLLGADAGAVESSGYTDALAGAQRSLVSLGALGVHAEVGDLGDLTGGAGDRESLCRHQHVEAAGLGLAEVTRRVLSSPTELTLTGKSRPLRIVEHDWDVKAEDEEEDNHERLNQVEVRHDTVTKTSHSILTFLEVEVEEGLVRATLTVILKLEVSSVGFQSIGAGETSSLFFILFLFAEAVASEDSNDWVKEREADLNVEIPHRVHGAKNFLRVADFLAIHSGND